MMKSIYFLSIFSIAVLAQETIQDTFMVQNYTISEDDLIIQEMQSDDADQIRSLYEESPDIVSYTGTSSDGLLLYLKSPHSYKIYVCKNRHNGNVYGFLLAMGSIEHYYIRAIGVSVNYRRFGIATKLLKAVYDFAQKEKYPKLTIHASNEKAEKCYNKFGFQYDATTNSLAILL